MRVLVTGGAGVLGRALLPLLAEAGHTVSAPEPDELDLFDSSAVAGAVEGSDAVYHLATRIPPLAKQNEPGAWAENDRLRTDASRLLVDAALATGVEAFLQPTVTFVYPDGPADENTPIGEVRPFLRSDLDAEREASRFAAAGRRGVVLRLGLLDGTGTRYDRPNPRYGATLHVEDAGLALLVALEAPSGIYNVVRDGERVSNERFKRVTGWRPRR